MNKPSAEEMQEFMGQVAMFKDMKKSMVNNMTCVLTKLGKLDKNLGMYVGNYISANPFFKLSLWLRCANYILFIWVAIYSQTRLCMQNILYLNHHLLSNYYCNYQNYQSEQCNLGINVPTNKQ